MKYSYFYRSSVGVDFIECPGNPKDPIIIFCHGYGANAENLLFLTSNCSFKTIRPTWIFPQGILSLSGEYKGGRAWFPLNIELFQELINTTTITDDVLAKYQSLFHESLNKPCDALSQFIQALNVPTSQIILGGFSQGAMLTTHTILTSQTAYMGALICSGALILNQGWDKIIDFSPQTPFLQTHGIHDSILPYHLGKSLYYLLSTKLQGEWVSFEGGHEMQPIVLRKIEELISSWSIIPSV